MNVTLPHGRYDSGERRRARREGRERGCWVYIPAEELLRASVDPYGPPPLYRTWGSRRGSVLVRLYRDDRPRPGIGHVLAEGHDRKTCPHCGGAS